MPQSTGSQSSLYFILYVSYATKTFSERELTILWQNSAASNADLNITGMLLHLNHRFIQVLEGEKSQVQATYDKILRDKRHKDVMVVLEGYTDSRNFENWSMGFYQIDKNSDHNYISAGEKVLDQIESWEVISEEHPVLSFLKMFYEKQNNSKKSSQIG